MASGHTRRAFLDVATADEINDAGMCLRWTLLQMDSLHQSPNLSAMEAFANDIRKAGFAEILISGNPDIPEIQISGGNPDFRMFGFLEIRIKVTSTS